MKSLPTLFYDKQELLLDIDIYGKIVSTPQTSREDLAKLLFEEFKFTHPVPSMEDERYKLSDLISTDYKIQYDNALELQENETLVDLQQSGVEQQTTDIFKIEVPKELQELFSYGKPVDEDYKMSLMEKFALLDDEDSFDRGIATTEKLYGSVKEDISSILSDEEIDNIGKVPEQDEEYDICFEDDEDDISDDEISDEYLDDANEESDDFPEYLGDEDEEEYDLSSEDEDELIGEEEDFAFNDDEFDSSESNITTNEEESEQTSEEVDEDSEYDDTEYEEAFDEEEYDDYSADEEDFDDDMSYDDDSEDDDILYDDSEDDDISYDDSEDDDDYSYEDSEDYEEDDISADYEEDDLSSEDEEDLSSFDDSSSDEDEDEEDADFDMEFEEESEPEPPKSINSYKSVAQEEIKPKPKPAPLTENKMFGDEDDVDLNQFGGVIEPDKPKVPEPQSSEFGDNEPKELRAFLKKHPRCEMSVVLKYFSKKEVETQIRLGKVIKRGNTLRI